MAAHQATSGLTPLSDAEHTSIEESYNTVIERHGKHFDRDYGWAAPVKNNYNPKLSDLEGELEFNHLVPYTKMAYHNIHAGAMRLYSSLGTNGLDDDLLLTGPSHLGLCIPIQLTANSLTQLTVAFQTLEDTLDNHYRDRMLIDLSTMISQVSVKAADQVKVK